MLKHRQEDIKAKGFNIMDQQENNYAKMRVGLRTVDDISVNLSSYKKINRNYGDKQFVLNAIYKHDYRTLREISNYFYESNGIYYKLCRYLATLYRYDWYVTPYINNGDNNKKILKDFSDVLLYFDNSDTKRVCGSLALDIIKEGVSYGIITDFGDRFAVQKLPPAYCRSRYYSGPYPVVELNLQFFDAYFPQPQYKIQILKTFSKDVQQAYVAYKEGRLKGDTPNSKTCWYPLNPETTFKLSLNDNDFPSLVGVIPSIIDLDQAQELDRQKTMQQLLKIIVQKLPLDKNGDLIFDVDEARDIHNNAVLMLKRAIGVDVLTTFADIEKIDTKDSNSATTTDDLEKVERTVFNNAGISHNLFNADGNLAVTNSILVDEASVRDMVFLFKGLLNRVITKFDKKRYKFRIEMLETTQFNYKELAKLYKEHAQMGYSKMLPQIALGHSQSSILATMMFENDVLNLAEIMIPPITSATMNSTVLSNKKSSTTEEKEAGRPQKEDQEKSDKTLQNKEAQS